MARVTRSLIVLACVAAVVTPATAATAAIRLVGTLAGPSLAAMYPSGGEYDPVNQRIVVADTGLNRVLLYSLNGVELDAFGTYGDGDYAFDTPRDIAIDGAGRIYVADAANNAVKAYTANGVHRWTKQGAPLNTPIGLTWDHDNDELLVASTGTGRVVRYTAGGTQVGNQEVLPAIRDVARGPDGLLYVADYRNHRIKAYDDSVTPWTLELNVGGTGDGDLSFPYNIAWSPSGDVMYVSDTGHNVVKAWNGSTWSTIGERCPLNTDCDTPDPRMDGVRRVAVTPAGEILVFDFWGSGINGFAANGSVTRQIAGVTPDPSGFAHASGVDVAKVNGTVRIYAVDRLNQTVEWYTKDGQIQDWAGDRGTQPKSVSWPEAVAVTSEAVYLGDTRNDRVVIWDHALDNVLGTIGAPNDDEFSEVADLEVLGDTIYVADRRHDRVARVTGGTVQDCVTWPRAEGVAVGSGGAIYVTGTQGIARFDGCGGGPVDTRGLDAIGVEVRRSDGSVFVTTPSRVLRLAPDLTTVRGDVWNKGLYAPHTLSVLGRKIYVADTYNHRIRVFRLG
jgi:DNA-binding beta-propeller fold protein YncE